MFHFFLFFPDPQVYKSGGSGTAGQPNAQGPTVCGCPEAAQTNDMGIARCIRTRAVTPWIGRF